MAKKILFITSLNLAANPRLVKEIHYAKSLGWKIQVICYEFNNDRSHIDQVIYDSLTNVTFIKIKWRGRFYLSWYFQSFLEKGLRFLYRFKSLKGTSLCYAFSRRSYQVNAVLNQVEKPDLVIGHNPASILPSYKVAKRFNCSVGFDLEDYHPGEGSLNISQRILINIFKEYLPKFNYISCSSTSILLELSNQIKFTPQTIMDVIQNSFPSTEFSFKEEWGKKIKLVWFSQYIDYGRGLEKILPYLKQFEDQIELDLFGTLNKSFASYLNDYHSFVKVFPFHEHTELQKLICGYDIGLAIEPAKDLNNTLALSNKLLSYFQAGLYILATATIAQEAFMKDHKEHGQLLDLSFSDIGQVLNSKIKEITEIRKTKRYRFERAKLYSFDSECLKYNALWNH